MTGELDRFKRDLGRQLVAAAHRQQSSPARPTIGAVPGWVLLPLAGAGILMAVALLAVGTLGAPPVAAADVFAIRTVSNRIELSVVDTVVDPDAVTRQLNEELGLEATLDAVAVPDAMVGRIISAGTNGNEELEYTLDDQGAVDTVVLPVGFNGALFIEYGQVAEPGEDYWSTVTDPACAALWGSTPAEALPAINRLATTARYELHDASDSDGTPVPFEALDPSHRLVDLSFLDDSTVLATFTADLDRYPRHPNCDGPDR